MTVNTDNYFPTAANASTPSKKAFASIETGALLAGHYRIVKEIGAGSSGTVYEAHDSYRNQRVAIKVTKAALPYFRSAQREAEFLFSFHRMFPGLDEVLSPMIRPLDSFTSQLSDGQEHYCLVLPKMQCNLFEYLESQARTDGQQGLPLETVKSWSRQIFTALGYLRAMDVIHLDVKPENIMLRAQDEDDIHLLDFGHVLRSNPQRPVPSYQQSRFYRSPEIFLGYTGCLSSAADMWSAACVLAELYSGIPLFGSFTTDETVLKQYQLLGPPAPDLQAQFKNWGRYSKEVLHKEVGFEDSVEERLKKWLLCKEADCRDEYEAFIDLLVTMLKWNPEDRPRPHDLLEHPFIVGTEPR